MPCRRSRSNTALPCPFAPIQQGLAPRTYPRIASVDQLKSRQERHFAAAHGNRLARKMALGGLSIQRAAKTILGQLCLDRYRHYPQASISIVWGRFLHHRSLLNYHPIGDANKQSSHLRLAVNPSLLSLLMISVFTRSSGFTFLASGMRFAVCSITALIPRSEIEGSTFTTLRIISL
jgi:hypothetical protein